MNKNNKYTIMIIMFFLTVAVLCFGIGYKIGLVSSIHIEDTCENVCIQVENISALGLIMNLNKSIGACICENMVELPLIMMK